MPKGGLRTPAGGRPVGTTKQNNRTIRKDIRFTDLEWSRIKTASIEYGGRETDFMRDAVMEKTEKSESPSHHLK
jgi:hypothetical protein